MTKALSFADRLQLATLEARAIEAGADPERCWPIVALAPPSPSYRLKSPGLGRFLLTENGWAATVDALKQLADRERVPCFNEHSEIRAGHPQDSVLRLIPKNGTGPQSRVGDIVALAWDDDIYGLIGVLEALPAWNDKLMTEWLAGDLQRRGFSVHIRGGGVHWRPTKHSMKKHTIHQEIELYSIDLVTFPAAAGRFLLPGCERTYEEVDQADLDFFKFYGLAAAWIDNGEEK